MTDFKDSYLRKLFIPLHDVDASKAYTLVTIKNLTVTKEGLQRPFKLYRDFAGYKWYPHVVFKNEVRVGEAINSEKLIELHFEHKDEFDIHVESSLDYNETWWLIPNIDYGID
jgi:hypothetical protein